MQNGQVTLKKQSGNFLRSWIYRYHMTPKILYLSIYPRAGFFNHSSIDIWGQIIVYYGPVLCILRWLAPSLTCTHSMLVALPPSSDNQKCLQKLPNGPGGGGWGAKLPPVENQYPRETETSIHTKTCAQMCIAALFIVTRNQKQPKHPSTKEWINEWWYTHTMEWPLIHATPEKNLKGMIPSETNLMVTYCIIPFLWHPQRDKWQCQWPRPWMQGRGQGRGKGVASQRGSLEQGLEAVELSYVLLVTVAVTPTPENQKR